ncbi:MAG: DUF3883 domain-containing protein, partial [Clostridia bacterium]|nr:DUF3883 domain-containing protein [Clostridia bacterium]
MNFLISTIDEEYVNMIHDFAFYEKTIQNDEDKSDDLLNAKCLLGATPQFTKFWKIVFGYKRIEINIDAMEESEIENQVKNNLGINLSEFPNVEYEKWNTKNSINLLELLSEQIGKEFLSSLDLSSYHKGKMEEMREVLYENAKKSIYSDLLSSNDIEKKKKFLDFLEEYDSLLDGFDYHKLPNTIFIDYEEKIKEVFFSKFSIKLSEVLVDIKSFYPELGETLKYLSKTDKSLQYFPDMKDYLTKQIERYEEKVDYLKNLKGEHTNGDNNSHGGDLFIGDGTDYSYINTPEGQEKNVRSGGHGGGGHGNNHDPLSDLNRQFSGEEAEKRVNELLHKHKELFHDIHWISSAAPVSPEQSDDAGYDFYYKDADNNRHCLEVKNYSNNGFYLSINEWEAAKREENYDIA